MGTEKKETVIGYLAARYPQLYLDPDTDSTEQYRAVTLRGEQPESCSLSGYCMSEKDREEMVETPAGVVRVVTLYARADFERVLRSLMGAVTGPGASIPQTQGAAMFKVPDWEKIRAHSDVYMDWLIILSVGPYSAVPAADAGFGEEEWITVSHTIRKYHELTHYICRSLYPEQVCEIWDELAADAAGLFAALGTYDIRLAKRFLGIDGETYTGGRLGNYTAEPAEICPQVCAAMQGIEKILREQNGADVFPVIRVLEENQKRLGF